MRRDLSTLAVPFPSKLMSAARSPAAMPSDFARQLLNIYALQSGAGAKRNGVVNVGNALSEESFVKLVDYLPTSGVQQLLGITASGKIYRFDGTDWQLEYSGLNTAGTVRSTHFAGKLILTNGIDPVLAWDGMTVSIISEYVEDTAANLTYVSSTSFTIDSDAALYPVDYKLKAQLGIGVEAETTIASVSGTGTITVTVADSVLTAALDKVYFEARPPTFAYITAAHDRLWGFGSGPLIVDAYSNSVDRMRVYYSASVNDETSWHDATGALQSINLADKLPVLDELMAMAVKDGLTIFFGRTYTQLWQGSDPTASGNMAWLKTLPVGVLQGDLVQSLPNDVMFFSQQGVRSLSRVLQTEQLDVTDIGREVDLLSRELTQLLWSSDANYRHVQAFSFAEQGWYGFQIGARCVIFQILATHSGWTEFDGVFADATALHTMPHGTLYLASGGQLQRYDTSVYSDADATITTRWWTPWLTFNKSLKRWANKYVEILTEQSQAFSLTLKRYKNYDSGASISQSATLTGGADYWDSAVWDSALWDNGAVEPIQLRDKCVADSLAYVIENSSTNGPLTFFGMKLHGRAEK